MPDYRDFDLDRSTAESWLEFEQRLAEVVSMIDDSADFTLGCVAVDEEPVPFVRFHSRDRDTLLAEAASNAVVGEKYQLGPAELTRLSELGWQDPTSEPEQPGDPVSENFWVLRAQEQSEALAGLAVSTLRDVYGVQHPVFLAPDQLAEILTPAPEPVVLTEYDAEDVAAVVPAGVEHLRDLVEVELTEMFGHTPLHDAEGDIAIRVGSTMLFLRLSSDAREVLVFASLVHDVEGRSRAVEVLNDLNADARMVKFQLIRDRVFVTCSVMAHPFVPAHLHQAVTMMAEVADGIDDELAGKLRGRTTFGPDAG
ncbi:T3SS (YopN, CesT) and YbjN peptide-binding chaperone 1 [Auraticoccus monumenti]|uniref:Putative sensory transduction regulator n=1 Tax=Auraticoccus monumenti TaxID=675864 RepID=A0A1G7CJ10_9ACTN|nr:YbjN domain-containing protein [Auraticoccus monumenti]SDE39243.1 Putative sensory transduction regulator [Auraticoccus monumenti]